MSYAVSGRVHEIGVRTALGTQRHDIFRLVVGSGMRLAAIGLALGAAAALVATRAMTSLLSAFARAIRSPISCLQRCSLSPPSPPATSRHAVPSPSTPLVALRYE